MSRKLTFYFLLYTVIIVSFSMSLLAMEPKRNNKPTVKKRKGLAVKIERIASIPDRSNSTSLKEYINQSCSIKSDEINRLESHILKNFKETCGLTPKNWQSFEQQLSQLKSYDRLFLPPKDFKQYITPYIPDDVIKNLENNIRRNNICFEKINIYSSKEIIFQEGIGYVSDSFYIDMPFYLLKKGYQTLLTFQSNRIAINYDSYHTHRDFLNICIVAAFTREIPRIKRLFRLIYEFQKGEELLSAARSSTLLQSNMFLQQHLNMEKKLESFVRDYGFKVGILYLTLKNSGIAKVINHYLNNNQLLSQTYGLYRDTIQSFFHHMEVIDSLKSDFRALEKEEAKYIEFMGKNELDLGAFA